MVRVGLIQQRNVLEREKNLQKSEKLIDDAVRQDADIVCLQELFTGIYFPQYQEKKFIDMYAEPVPGPSYEHMSDIAKNRGIVLVVPIYEAAQPGAYYNTAMVFDADGTYLGKYRKTHLPHLPKFWEKYYFTPGDLGYPVFDTRYGKVGIAICYDRHFPEPFRILALKGAEIVLVPTATAGWTKYLWDLEIRGHAVANMFFVAGLNRVGEEDEMNFYGSSYISDPRGEVVNGHHASDKEDDVLVEEIDLSMIKEVRDTWHFFRDRRPSQYKELAQYPMYP
ncbi:MAG: nitrilase-related carbon-nitrogen hydrolase [Thermoplasmata archaeon]